MPSTLDQLDVESTLLMFLAGELPAEDHAAVARRIETDPQLRAQLDELRSAYGGVEDAIAAADAVERVTLPEATAARRVGQAARSWHVRRLANPPERELGGRLRLPPWAYAAASVAAAVIVALGIWGLRSDNTAIVLKPLPGPGIAMEDPGSGNPDPTTAAATAAAEYDAYAVIHDNSENEALAAAEDELYALTERSPGDVPAMLMLGETDEQ
jgi:hypothetical protein